ncbi:CocE/NonD family hydrolase C-terminal non-catalytic domain-containing protein [Streptomyces sp. NPDC020731]|uniref:CocE/NonD family hydrolase C-terminal non-catalytic domain-containing protein n=1 Tax=Streptomyces sp. NPDC020731 TaxID=3365085 RepID=UPI0037B3AA27
MPVEPGRTEEYVLRVHPFAATFLPGHKLVVELSGNGPPTDALPPPDAFHLPVDRPATHKIYRDAVHPSRLVLPFTKREADREQPARNARTAKPEGECQCPVAR